MATEKYSFDLGKIISDRLLNFVGIGEIFNPSDNLIDFLEAAALENADELKNGIWNNIIQLFNQTKYKLISKVSSR